MENSQLFPSTKPENCKVRCPLHDRKVAKLKLKKEKGREGDAFLLQRAVNCLKWLWEASAQVELAQGGSLTG